MNRTWRQRNRGAVLVEFAILTPILVLLAFGIAELGRVLYQQNTLTKSVASGARYLARSYDILDTDDCAAKPLWSSKFVPEAKNLVVYGTFTAGSNPLVPNLESSDVVITYRQGSVSVGGGHHHDDDSDDDDDDDDDDDIKACIINVSATVLFAGIFRRWQDRPVVAIYGRWI